MTCISSIKATRCGRAPSSSVKLDGDWMKEGKSWWVPKRRPRQWFMEFSRLRPIILIFVQYVN